MFEIEDFVHRNFDNPVAYGSPQTDWRVECPFCESLTGTPDLKGKLHIGIDIQAVHCFRCGYKANWVKFVMDVTGCNYANALGELYVVPKIRQDISKTLINGLSVSNAVKTSLDDVNLPSDFVPLVRESLDSKILLDTARKYALGRGFSDYYWKRYNLGVSSSIGWRLVIPVEGQYWQARSLAKWLEPKYINPDYDADKFIFNSSALEDYDDVVICEGCFNAMAVGDNAIAILGKEVPVKKLHRLVDANVKRYIVALDKDAMRWSNDLANKLQRAGKEVIVWSFLTDKDAADGGAYKEVKYDFAARVRMSVEQ